MPLDAEYLVDRRRLRRSVSVWRALAFLLAAVVLIAAGVWFAAPDIPGRGVAHIARVEINGIIIDDRERAKMLDRLAESDAVEAVIVSINSPGGTTTASENLFKSLRDIAAEKPVVTVMGTTAASGGYIAALGGDHMIAHRTSITGSIGVLFQWPDVTELLDNIGVQVNSVKSAPLKAEPNPFEPTTEEAREAVRAIVADSYEWFLDLVRERRSLDGAALRRVADGRVYTGGQALELDLVDELGDEETAKAWLVSARGIDDGLKVRDWEADTGFPGLGASVVAGVAGELGLHSLARYLTSPVAMDAASLDGIVALWHPQLIEE